MAILRDDFQAIVTRTGTVACTASSRALAVAWVKDRMALDPGIALHVDQVTVTETRRRVYRPRPAPVATDLGLDVPCVPA